MSPAATPTSTPTSSPGSAAAQQAEELGSSPSVATPAELSSTRSKNSIDEAWLAGARKRRKAFGAGAGEAEKMLTDLMVDSLHSSAATEAKGSGKRSSAVIARGFMSFILLAGLVVRHPSSWPGCVSYASEGVSAATARCWSWLRSSGRIGRTRGRLQGP